MMVYRYLSMYFVMGLIATFLWVVGATAYTMGRFYVIKNGPTQQETEDFLDDFTAIMWNCPNRMVAHAERKELEKRKDRFVLLAVGSYLIWPWNIGYGLSRMPELNRYFNEISK